MKFFQQVKVPVNYTLVDSPRKLSYLAEELSRTSLFAFDIETTHPTVKSKDKVREYLKVNPVQVAGIAFAWDRNEEQPVWAPGKAAYVPLLNRDETPFWRTRQDSVLRVLKEVLENDKPKVAHNAKFDVSELAKILKIFTKNVKFDTMLAHAILDEDKRTSSHALKSDFDKKGNVLKKGCADTYLSIQGSAFKEDLGDALVHYDPNWRRYSKVPMDIIYPYACADADMTLSLVFPFLKMLEEEELVWVFQNIVMPLQHSIMLLELHGAPLNIPKAQHVEKEQNKIMEELTPVIHEIAGKEFLISSNDQLGKVIFDELGLSGGMRNKRGGWIVDSDMLKKIDHPIVDPILKYRRALKIQSTYATAALHLVKEVTGDIGWIHPTYWLDSATGRLKCQDPNLTNLPRPDNGGDIVKSMYQCAEDYRILFKDFSQIELRVIAHESNEPVWVDGFNAGHDMHAAMAHKVFKLDCEVNEVAKKYKEKRSQAKAINFGIAFGESEYSLAESLKITFEEAHDLIHKDYFGTAPVLKRWIDDTHKQAERIGYVTNMFGRRRHLEDAQILIPQSVKWPIKEERPNCYRRCAAPYQLDIAFEDLHVVSTEQLKLQIRSKRLTKYFKCCDCKYLKSCFINSEVRYLESKKSRALRQSVNSVIQGGAADMTSLCLIEITKRMQEHNLRSNPILYIHDEIGCYTHVQDLEKAERIMEDVMTNWIRGVTNFRVPVLTDTEIVRCWGDKK